MIKGLNYMSTVEQQHDDRAERCASSTKAVGGNKFVLQ